MDPLKPMTRNTKWPWRLPARASGWPGDVPRLPPPKWPGHAVVSDPCAASHYGCAAALVVLVAAGCAVALVGRASARAHENALRASCQDNLKQLGLALKTYASEHSGDWPDLKPGTAILQPDWALLDGLNAPARALTCPAERTRVARTSYYYLGYEITSDQDAEAFASALSTRIADGGAFDVDLPVSDSIAGATISKLRDHDRSTDALRPDQIPVVLERATNHNTAGLHVLYQDGHVEYIKFGERFPVTRRTLTALSSLESGLYPVAPLAPHQLRHWEPGNCGGVRSGFVLEGPKN